MAADIFITGATGFLGSRLLAGLLRHTDCRFHLLVRSHCAEDLLTRHLPPADLARVCFVRGDITLPRLGLDDGTVASMARSVTEVWHLAASTNFEESKRDETFHVNVEGTRNLLGVVRQFGKLDIFYYMSTAYVCGKKLDCVPEGPFDVTEGFKNPYEESKHVAEKVVRSSGLPVAILRPSITLGDSQTGDSGGESRMMYGYALGVLRAAMHAFDSSAAYWDYWRDGHADGGQELKNVNARLLSSYETLKNMVTLDDVLAVCVAVRDSGAGVGRTYHIVNPRNISCREIINVLQRAAKVTGYVLDPTLTSESVKGGTVVERAAYRYTKLFWPYATLTEPRWETCNVDRLSVQRVPMTENLFEFLIKQFVRYLAPPA